MKLFDALLITLAIFTYTTVTGKSWPWWLYLFPVTIFLLGLGWKSLSPYNKERVWQTVIVIVVLVATLFMVKMRAEACSGYSFFEAPHGACYDRD